MKLVKRIMNGCLMCLTYVDGTEVALQGRGKRESGKVGREGKGVRLRRGKGGGGPPKLSLSNVVKNSQTRVPSPKA